MVIGKARGHRPQSIIWKSGNQELQIQMNGGGATVLPQSRAAPLAGRQVLLNGLGKPEWSIAVARTT